MVIQHIDQSIRIRIINILVHLWKEVRHKVLRLREHPYRTRNYNKRNVVGTRLARTWQRYCFHFRISLLTLENEEKQNFRINSNGFSKIDFK